MQSNEPQPFQSGRRNVLTLLVGGFGALLFASVVYPVLRFMNPPKRKVKTVNSAVVAQASEIPPNSGKVVSFNGEKVLIVNKDGEHRAMSAVCTHLGCIVQWKPDERLVWCACHNARYDAEGNIISGPQPRPLAPYNLKTKDGALILTRSASPSSGA